MTTVESRKKAKEDYLKLLQQQKESVATIQNNPEIPTQLNSVTHDSKAGRREQLLAEKRKAFFEGKQAVASHPVETASSENKQIAPKTVPDFTAPVKEPQPSSKNENFRLSDWKKLGFLSEYAYAKHLGLLQDKKDIPPPADAATTDRLRLDNENNLLFPIKSLENPHIPSDVRAADRAANGLGLLEAQKKPQSEAHSINTAISNIDSNGMVDKISQQPSQIETLNEKDLKRKRQEEYARELEKQMQNKSPQYDVVKTNSTKVEANKDTKDSFQIGSQLDKDEKRKRQMEYANALQRDQQKHQSLQPQTQSQSQARKEDDNRLNGRDVGYGEGMSYGGGVGRGGVNHQMYGESIYSPGVVGDREREMRKDPMSMGLMDGRDVGGLGPARDKSDKDSFQIGSQRDKDEKRKRQMEYANALQRDQQKHQSLQPQPQSQPQQSRREDENRLNGRGVGYGEGMSHGGGGGGVNHQMYGYREGEHSSGLGVGAMADRDREMRKESLPVREVGGLGLGLGLANVLSKDEKRAKQMQYAKELEKQLALKSENAQSHPHRRELSNAFDEALSSANQPHFQERESRKAKQNEYARALMQQLEGKQHHQPRNITVESDGSSRANQLGPGWVMGPLGVPVRKTLEVGNRGVQKAFNEHVIQQVSPPKQLPNHNLGDNHFYNDSVTGVSQLPYIHENYHLETMGNVISNGLGNAMNNLPPSEGAGFGDEDEAKKKHQRLQQMKALEEQIRMNKARAEQERLKQEEEERREQLRIEKDMREIKEAFEREQQAAKVKAHEENKQKLEEQIEQKRREKIEQERRQRELEAQEELRLEKEREELAKRLEREKQQEWMEEQRKQRNPAPQIPQFPEKPQIKSPENRKPSMQRALNDDNSTAATRLRSSDHRRMKLFEAVENIDYNGKPALSPDVTAEKNKVQSDLESPLPPRTAPRSARQSQTNPASSDVVQTARPPSVKSRNSSRLQHHPSAESTPSNFLEQIMKTTWESTRKSDIGNPLLQTLPHESKFVFPDGRIVSTPSAIIKLPTDPTAAKEHGKDHEKVVDLPSNSRHSRPTTGFSDGPSISKHIASDTSKLRVERETITTPGLLRDSQLITESTLTSLSPLQKNDEDYHSSPLSYEASKRPSHSSRGTSRPTTSSLVMKELLFPTNSVQENLRDVLPFEDADDHIDDPSQFNIEKELKRNQRKWQLLQKLNNLQTNEMQIRDIFNEKNLSARAEPPRSSSHHPISPRKDITSQRIGIEERPLTATLRSSHHNSSNMRSALAMSNVAANGMLLFDQPTVTTSSNHIPWNKQSSKTMTSTLQDSLKSKSDTLPWPIASPNRRSRPGSSARQIGTSTKGGGIMEDDDDLYSEFGL